MECVHILCMAGGVAAYARLPEFLVPLGYIIKRYWIFSFLLLKIHSYIIYDILQISNISRLYSENTEDLSFIYIYSYINKLLKRVTEMYSVIKQARALNRHIFNSCSPVPLKPSQTTLLSHENAELRTSDSVAAINSKRRCGKFFI